MSTRAIVAVPHGRSWRGRYTHSDGYPFHHVPTLLSIVQRDGLARAIQVLTVEHHSWSMLDDSETREGPGKLGERSVRVPGYGDAYVDQDGGSSADHWIRAEHEDTWCMYAYVLSPDGLVVLADRERRNWVDRIVPDGIEAVVWTEIDRVAWSERPRDAHLRLAEQGPGQYPEAGMRWTRMPAEGY